MNTDIPRRITDHQIPGTMNSELTINALHGPGAGGANYKYEIRLPDRPFPFGLLEFQNGPLGEVGINGVTNEALLAILIDRMRGFQSGPFKCRENAIALTHLEDALHWLQHRTRQRLNRGVEGTHTP